MVLSGDFRVEVGALQEDVVVSGPIAKQRFDPEIDLETGKEFIPTRCNSINLTGEWSGGTVVVRDRPEKPTIGKIEQVTAGVDFPATSFFDVFFELLIFADGIPEPVLVLHNQEPVHISTTINELVPVGAVFVSSDVVTLYDEGGSPQGELLDVSRTVASRLDVGGIAELPDLGALPLETAGSSGVSVGVLIGVAAAAALAAGAVTLGGAAWYARRRVTS